MPKGLGWIIFGVVVFAAGVLLPFAMILPLFLGDGGLMPDESLLSEKGPFSRAGQYQQFIIPGETRVEVAEPGRYYLWNDFETVFEGRSYSSGLALPGGLTISVTPADGSPEIPMQVGMDITENIGGTNRKSIGYFEIPRTGGYDVRVTGTAAPQVFSFGRSIFGDNPMKFMISMMIAGLSCFLLVMGGMVMMVLGVVFLVRERREKNAPA